MMPHRDGWSVLQVLKNDPELRSIPVIMLSILDNRNLGYALGVEDYIVKPFNRRELLEKLKATDRKSLPGDRVEGGPSQTVLVVDDEESIVDFLAETLRAEGYQVESVMSGKRALEKLMDRAPDILFVDLMLPGVSGFDVIEYLANTPALKKVRVIVLTAKRLTPREMDYLQNRVEVIIQKGSRNLTEILSVLKERLATIGGSR